MVTFGRVLLWTVVLIAPGGFLLVPVLAATSLRGRNEPAPSLRELASAWLARARQSVGQLQRHWTKS